MSLSTTVEVNYSIYKGLVYCKIQTYTTDNPERIDAERNYLKQIISFYSSMLSFEKELTPTALYDIDELVEIYDYSKLGLSKSDWSAMPPDDKKDFVESMSYEGDCSQTVFSQKLRITMQNDTIKALKESTK